MFHVVNRRICESVQDENEQADQENEVQECLQILALSDFLKPLRHKILLKLTQTILQCLISSRIPIPIPSIRSQRIDPTSHNLCLAALVIPQVAELASRARIGFSGLLLSSGSATAAESVSTGSGSVVSGKQRGASGVGGLRPAVSVSEVPIEVGMME